MAKAPQFHVVQHGDTWAVKRDGAVQSRHRTQADAASAARSIAQIVRGEVSIHGVNGKVRDKNSYGNDPFPPRG